MEAMAGEVTHLLGQVSQGNAQAEDQLVRLVYAELKSVAKNKLRSLSNGATLTPTVLVHEAYFRVFRANGIPLRNRKHLFFAFAQAMWRIVVEHQRRKHMGQTGDGLENLECYAQSVQEDVLDLDAVLIGFRLEHPREYEVLMLRKTLGFSIEETAELLDTSSATVKRDWAFAKAELSRKLNAGVRP